MINLIHGDCIEEMKKLADNSIDCCITDPPYGTTSCKWDTVIPFNWFVIEDKKVLDENAFFEKYGKSIESIEDWENLKQPGMWQHLKRIVKPNGAICLFGSEPFSSKLRLSNLEMFKYDWVWCKNKSSGMGYARYRPMNKHELISIFASGKTMYNKQTTYTESKAVLDAIERGGSRGKSTISEHHKDIKAQTKPFSKVINPHTLLKFKVVNNGASIKCHPTQKPVKLLEYLVSTYTLENEMVLDFTMGSGSTGVACKNLNRKFIGIEKELKYYEIAKQRLEL